MLLTKLGLVFTRALLYIQYLHPLPFPASVPHRDPTDLFLSLSSGPFSPFRFKHLNCQYSLYRHTNLYIYMLITKRQIVYNKENLYYYTIYSTPKVLLFFIYLPSTTFSLITSPSPFIACTPVQKAKYLFLFSF